MFLDNQVISFKGMPLFQKAKFRTPFTLEGKILDFACFFYMVEGNMHSYDSRGLHELNEKEAVLKNCNNYVQKYLQTENSTECTAIAIYLYPELLKKIYKDEVPSFLKEDKQPNPKKLINNQLIEQYMMNLSVYFEDPEALDEELGILKLKELMLILLKSQNHESIRILLSEIFAPINVAFKEAVENNIFNNLSLEQLAFLCNMSLSTFKRTFEKTFNDTPARYIKKRRLDHAASQLVKSDLSVSDIAFESGFQDLTTFSASFREKFEVSPSQYRLNLIRN